MDIHRQWRNGQECMRVLEVEDGLFINMLLPIHYWSLYDQLAGMGYKMARCVRACWADSLEWEDGPAPAYEYEIFRRFLVNGILLFEDIEKARIEGRENDNQEHLSHLWNGHRSLAQRRLNNSVPIQTG